MARQSQVQFTIPEPCNVPWHSMSPVDSERRHCSSCERVITDFSKMSDDELMLYFRHNDGKICGRLSNTQLNRSIQALPEKTEKAKWWRTLALIPLTFFGKQVKAQYFDAVYSNHLPDTERIVSEPVLQNDSAETIVENTKSELIDSVTAPIRILVSDSTGKNTLTYVWAPTTYTVYTSFLMPGATPLCTGGFTVMVLLPPAPPTNFILDTIRTIRDSMPVKKTFEKWITLNTNQKVIEEKKLQSQNPYRDLADKQEEKPKPQEPALPASTDITGILPQENRPKRRA
jgi:hypothetical protein